MRKFKQFLYLLAGITLLYPQFCVRLFELNRPTQQVYKLLFLCYDVAQSSEPVRHKTEALPPMGLDVPFRSVIVGNSVPVLRDGPTGGNQTELSAVAVDADAFARVL